MFRKNIGHLQQELFNDYSTMNSKIQERLKNTWAPVFYEHVFSRIDETPFAVLYYPDNGSPNFPINSFFPWNTSNTCGIILMKN